VAADLRPPCVQLEFEYVAIQKVAGRWEFKPVRQYWVDLQENKVSEKVLDSEFDPCRPALFSPVRESLRPGAFEPLPVG